ncbi:interferon-induced transmembrane protein 3-like [Elgaria multicarinata webbii]|uniref:interferon-induced transmembrane protein 3-like n=1 Tax=Elgaria multicarinata webbii TaxID=159646 RepID=UPI002FCD33D0
MASSAQFPFPVQGGSGGSGLPRYEQLKEEHDMLVMDGTGAPPRPTVIHMEQQQFYAKPPSDHFLWSVFTTLYFNFCCLGFMALAFSIKARDRKVLGDHNGAGSYGSTAKCLNIMALILSLLVVIVFIVLIVTGILGVAAH